MKSKITVIIILCWVIVQVSMGQAYHTQILSRYLKTLRVGVPGKILQSPVIELNGNDVIEIGFDDLVDQPKRYTYTLTHCNSDWTESNLTQSEFIRGFQNSTIEDYQSSFNTTLSYIHYKLFFPNSDLSFKISGNYVVKVFSEENRDKPVLTACFSVFEPEAQIRMTVDTRTDVDVNRSHQQLNFDVVCSDKIDFPAQSLKVYVFQNNRRDNASNLIQPYGIQFNKLIYDHSPKLIFEAGNEYRRFEMTSPRHTGFGIKKIEFHAPYYHVDLEPDKNRSQRPYEYAKELNGGYVVRDINASEPDHEADYFFVHFYLPCDQPFPDDVYLLGDAFNNLLNDESRMEFSEQDHGYVKTVLLKEGYYNYLYVTAKPGSTQGSTSSIEGNFYQTENEYSIFVYFRSPTARYDRLIGYKTN